MIDLDSQAPDLVLQRALEGWLRAGRVKVADFLPAPALAAEVEADEPLDDLETAAEPPDYVRRYREHLEAGAGAVGPAGVELLRAGSGAGRAREIISGARHTALLLYPRLTADAAGEALRAELQALAGRGVLTLVGWGTADERDGESVPPAQGVIEGLQRLQTPEGLAAVTVWWVGSLYGQDVVLDHQTLVSSVPNVVAVGQQRVAGGASTYVVTAPDLVSAALEDVEPPFARAARLSWHAAARSAVQARHALNRCCLTWVAVRRPGEALSHLLKLASHLAENEPEAMLAAWEALTVTLLGLARLPAGDGGPHAVVAEAADALRRAIPEFLDWSDSGIAPGSAGQTPFVAALRERLGRQPRPDLAGVAALLADVRALWTEHGPAGTGGRLSDAFIVASEADPRRERLKKRRF
jgi:hypothetical protein